MTQYIEFVLLGILLVLVYQKPNFLENIVNNKLSIILLLLLNGYIAKTYGITSGIIMAVIIIVLLENKEGFYNMKEGFVPKIQVWKPASFTGPCQLDLDRQIKENGERASMEATKQLNEHTNEGFRVHQKQLY